MSSPMMKRMFGFLSAACTGAPTPTTSPKARVKNISLGIRFMLFSCWDFLFFFLSRAALDLQGRAIALTVRDGEEKVLLLFRETVYGTLVPRAILNWPKRFSRSGLTRSKTKRFTSL